MGNESRHSKHVLRGGRRIRRIELVLGAISFSMVSGFFTGPTANARSPSDDTRGRFILAYEGKLDDLPVRDVSFQNVPLKQVLAELGRTLGLSYRVDRGDALTVIGEPAG